MEVSLTPTPLSYDSPIAHRMLDHLADISTEQQKLLTSIGLEDIVDIASPKGRSWTPICT